MAFRILIVEDISGARGLLADQLQIALRNRKAFNGKWDSRWPLPETIEFNVDPIRESDLPLLVSKQDDITFLNSMEKFLAKYNYPHLVITDLALTDEETELLQKHGGREEEKKVKDHGWQDPQIVLDQITGFRILQAIVERGKRDEKFSSTAIVTSYSNNPYVHKACIDKGAFAVIQKPMTDEDMDMQWRHYHYKNATLKLTKPQIKAAERGKPDIDKYIATIAIEVVKAFKDRALQLSYSHSPSPVPLWAAHEHKNFSPNRIKETNILLMDIRGFSDLVKFGNSKPEVVFQLMNYIWSEVFGILQKYDAEINNFIGDAALVFRGVYTDVPNTVKLEDSLCCAQELCEIFAFGGPVRTELEARIRQNFNSFAAREEQKTQKILHHINSEKFGLRIVVNAPDNDETLYGMAGVDGLRWQHTILSRFMNFLARSESAIGRWEKEGLFKQIEPAHSFLVWDEKSDSPSVNGFTFELPLIYLGKPREDIKDIPPGIEIYRVRQAAA